MTESKYQISVSPRAFYIAEQSDADAGRYAFAYTITITNNGAVPAQLISRHWIITDANNLVQEVKGQGVVGAQPKLKPGESFEYTSGSMLATPVGTMRGSYQMVADDGTRFDASIPEFTLSAPRVLH
ncbi:MAG: Protein ApaG [Pseudomonadota bacterium]|jgi:ApaG protein